MGRESLASRFADLWGRNASSANAEEIARIWESLSGHYDEPQRRYHNLDHISHCLTQLDLALDSIAEADAIELAIWFHDVIYDVDRSDNEARSAAFFGQIALPFMAATFIKRVHALILATTHISPADDLACQYMVDIDLSSFGLPWEDFRADSEALREEQANTPDDEFYAGKLGFLQILIGRPEIFQTGFFRARLEHQARNNIQRYQQELAARGFAAC